MTTTLQNMQSRLAQWVHKWTEPEPNRLDGFVPIEHLLDAVTAIYTASWGYLSAITGLDAGAEAGHFEVLYHFCSGAAVLSLRVQLSHEQAVIPSICTIFPYASPFERETGEMFGITFAGTPDTTRLFLSDDWPNDLYPLRKDANLTEVRHDSEK